MLFVPAFDSSIIRPRTNNLDLRSDQKLGRASRVKAMRVEKSLEELYNVRVERKVSQERLKELGVTKWSMWKTGKCKLPWDWHVDQLVYIEEGEVRVVPEGSKQYMSFKAGDLVRYPKWFEADLWFNGFYQERYSFRAYGDD
ncbi:Arginine N-succinyltransferase [Bienertia sinuspersici]